MLKGAVALHVRLNARFRATKDMDLGRWDDEQAATADLFAAQQVDLGDFFQFRVERTAKLDQLLEGSAVRYHISATLAGRRFEDFTVDVGFSDTPIPNPDLVHSLDFLSFAGIDPIDVLALPLEQHIAEKVHAYSRGYAGGRPSTRTKDLIDLVLMSAAFPFQAGHLRSALLATFQARSTHPLPPALPPPPAGWEPVYQRLAAEVGLEPVLALGHQAAARFLDPILTATVTEEAQWDPQERTW